MTADKRDGGRAGPVRAGTANAGMAHADAWRRAIAGELDALIAAAADERPGDVSAVARLRRTHREDDVAVALDIARARAKARAKYPIALADRLIADPPGVEMASSYAAAAWKARRIASSLDPSAAILDLCCGIGGDAIALASELDDAHSDTPASRQSVPSHAGSPPAPTPPAAGFAAMAPRRVTAIDIDPVRSAMAAANAGCAALVMDVADINRVRDLGAACIHLDPARREAGSGGRRRPGFDDCLPGPSVIAALIEAHSAAALKLAPGIDRARLPSGELEVICEDGTLTQAVLWTGSLAGRTGVRATRLWRTAGRQPATIAGEPDAPPSTEGTVLGWVHAVDPAVERVRLIHLLAGEHAAPIVCDGTGLLTSEGPIESPWLTSFRVVWEGSWSRRGVSKRLRDLGAGLVEVKTRGGVIDADAEQKALRGGGDAPFAVFVLRFGGPVRCLVTRRSG